MPERARNCSISASNVAAVVVGAVELMGAYLHG
jgi:hypothetical protein